MAQVNGIDVEAAQRLIEAVARDTSLGKTMWRARTVWRGGCQADSLIRDFTVRTDEPPDLGGTNTGPNPVEVLLAGLGGCLAVGYALNAAMMGISIAKLEIETEGDIDLPGFFGLKADVLPGYTTIRARVFLKSTASRDELQELHRRVTSTSPVGLSLGKEVRLDVELVERRVV